MLMRWLGEHVTLYTSRDLYLRVYVYTPLYPIYIHNSDADAIIIIIIIITIIMPSNYSKPTHWLKDRSSIMCS